MAPKLAAGLIEYAAVNNYSKSSKSKASCAEEKRRRGETHSGAERCEAKVDVQPTQRRSPSPETAMEVFCTAALALDSLVEQVEVT